MVRVSGGIVLLGVALLAGLLVLFVYPEAKFIILLLIVKDIWTNINQIFGPGLFSNVLSLVVIIIFLNYFWGVAALYLFYLLIGSQLVSILMMAGQKMGEFSMGEKEQAGGHH